MSKVMRQDDLVDVESVSEELYGLPLDEFTHLRSVREKEARSEGDKDLAAQIHQLAKPNLVAWLANQLVRKNADEIGPLLELGAGLREATATLSGEQLRELSRDQRRLVHALVEQARSLASAAGRKVSADTGRGLEDTLRAALADPDAAEALAAGRLTAGMQNSGFGGHTGLGERPGPSTKKPTTGAAPSPAAGQHAAEQRTRAEHDVHQAKSAADEALTERQKIREQLEATDQRVSEAGALVEQVRRELNQALEAQSRALSDQRRARTALDHADRGAREAQERLAHATESLERLAR